MPKVLVLHVDNDTEALAARSILIENAGFEVLKAAHEGDALELSEMRRPAVAVLKSGLTGIQGFELCRQLKSRAATADMQILVISSASDWEQDHVLALDSGADHYLHEPCPPVVLAASVRALARNWLSRSQIRSSKDLLRAEKERYQAITENTSEAIFLTDEHGRVTFANPAAERIFGWSQSELSQRVLHEVIHHNHRDGTPYPLEECPFARVLTSGMALKRQEDVFFRKDGSSIHATGSNAPIFRDGRVIGGVVVLSDISERQRADKRFRRLADQATVGVVTGDLDGSITYSNPVFLKMLGYGDADAVHHWRDIASDDACVEYCLNALRAQSASRPCETNLLAADGSQVPVMISATVLERRQDGTTYIAAYVTDLRSVYEAERALRSSEERRLLAIEAADMGTWFQDIRSGLLKWDDRCYSVFGVDRNSPLTYENFLELVHPEDRKRTEAAVHKAITEFQHYDIEYRIVKRDGEIRWISAKGQAYAGRDGTTECMQGIAIDITARKHAEERLKQLNDALQRSNRDLQEFTYAISHDLQEPLRMVNNFGQLIEKRHASDLKGEAREFFHFMIDGAQRMERMIRDLLNYSRVLNDEGTFEPTELRATLLWAMSNLDVLIQESGASITYDALPTVDGDFVRLSQVFQNVLCNSIKYRSADPPVIDIRTRSESGEWIIAVRDNGIGMDPKNADRAFGVFTRMHGSQYPGTGVGLAICKQIVERHRGRIWMETAPNAGSTIYFTLPQ